MGKLEQRCRGVQRVLDDYGIEYKKKYNSEKYLAIKGTPFYIDITNRYITVSYHQNKNMNFLPSFEGITEFREFVKTNGNNFWKVKNWR